MGGLDATCKTVLLGAQPGAYNIRAARRFYFAYCEAAFDARYIHNFQIVWAKSVVAAPDLTVLPSSSGELSKPVMVHQSAEAAPTDTVMQVLRPAMNISET